MISLIIAAIYGLHFFFFDSEGDISNSSTLIIEMGIGVFLGLSLLIYSNYDQNKIENTGKKIESVVNKLDENITSKEKYVLRCVLWD